MRFIYLIFASIVIYSCSSDQDNQQTTSTKKTAQHLEIPQDVLNSLKGGEVIMRKGGGFLSSQIVEVLDEPVPFSHCGIIMKTDSGLYIIHSLGRDYGDRDGVQPTSIRSFTADAIDSSLCIVRPKVPDSLIPAIQNTCLKYLEEGKGFDYSFDISNNERLHCTEFVHYVYLDAIHKDIYPIQTLETGVKTLLFKDFFNPNYFEVVYTMVEIPSIYFESDTIN